MSSLLHGSGAGAVTTSCRAFRLLVGGTLLFLSLTRSAGVGAGEMPVPMDIQVPLLLKVLSADRALLERTGGDLVIGVIYQANNRESSTTMGDFARLAPAVKAGPGSDMYFAVVPVPLEEVANLTDELTKRLISICYIAPLRSVDLESVVSAADSAHSLTCTGVPDYVQRGVAIGIGSKGDRPEILVNLEKAKAAGAVLSSQLLKLARIVSQEKVP
jgi:hypothetical protein